MIPFRIAFTPLGASSEEEIHRHIEASKGFPRVKPGTHEHPVAIAGGGPLLDIEALRVWPGDIWAINRTADYLMDRGIDCVMFTVDPSDSSLIPTNAARRLLATSCHPSLFVGDVQCFGMAEYEEGGVTGGTTSATRATTLALRLGYPGCVFFGCESCFEDSDHIDRDEGLSEQLLVSASGEVYKTRPDLLMQAEQMVQLLELFPGFVKEQSGGMLRAMLHDKQWEIVAVSDALKKHLIEVNGDDGLYDNPYAAQG